MPFAPLSNKLEFSALGFATKRSGVAKMGKINRGFLPFAIFEKKGGLRGHFFKKKNVP